MTHQWQDVAKSECDGWITGLFNQVHEVDEDVPTIRLTDDRERLN